VFPSLAAGGNHLLDQMHLKQTAEPSTEASCLHSNLASAAEFGKKTASLSTTFHSPSTKPFTVYQTSTDVA
jgi:hypothetical protein